MAVIISPNWWPALSTNKTQATKRQNQATNNRLKHKETVMRESGEKKVLLCTIFYEKHLYSHQDWRVVPGNRDAKSIACNLTAGPSGFFQLMMKRFAQKATSTHPQVS